MISGWFRLVSALFDEAGPLVGEVFQEVQTGERETKPRRGALNKLPDMPYGIGEKCRRVW